MDCTFNLNLFVVIENLLLVCTHRQVCQLADVMKLLGALNLRSPVQENKFRAVQEYVLGFGERAQEHSMATAVEEAVLESGSGRDVTVSGDGAWAHPETV